MKAKISHHSNAGFTLAEILIALLLMGFLAAVASNFMSDLLVQSKRASDRTETQLMEIVGNRQIWYDFRGAGVGLNAVKLPDDNDRNFFDYDKDKICVDSSGVIDECQRELTIDTENGGAFVILTEYDRRNRKMVTFDPVEAYDVGMPSDWTTDATLTYDQGRLGAKLELEGIDNSENLSSGKKFILFKSAGETRRVDTSGVPVADSIRRPAMMLAKADNIPTTVPATIFDWFNNIHPEHPDPSQVSAEFSDLDEYFLRTPPVGGRAGLVQAYTVRAVRYCLRQNDENEEWELARQTCAPTSDSDTCSVDANCEATDGWSDPAVTAFNVKSVVFRRNNINLPTMFFDIETETGL